MWLFGSPFRCYSESGVEYHYELFRLGYSCQHTDRIHDLLLSIDHS